MTLTKAKLVDRLHMHQLGLNKKELRDVLDTVFDVMLECFDNGERLKLSGFGNFSVKNKTARVGRNPHTEQEIIISRRRVLNFKASALLHKALNASDGTLND